MSLSVKIEQELISRNRLMISGLGASQAIMLTGNAMDALVGGIGFLTIMFLTAPLMFFLFDCTDRKATFPLAAIVAAPVALLVTSFIAGTGMSSPGVKDYLLLLAVNSALITSFYHARLTRDRVERCGVLIGSGCGYLIAISITGVIREIIASGSIFGKAIPYLSNLNFVFFASAPGGMIFLGLIMSFWRSLSKGDEKR